MRDPVFYRWHSFIDSIFQAHKSTLPPYTDDQLGFKGVEVTDVSINTGYFRAGSEKNVFRTFWEHSQMNLSRGLDFAPRGKIFVK
jgi:tyrosinase